MFDLNIKSPRIPIPEFITGAKIGSVMTVVIPIVIAVFYRDWLGDIGHKMIDCGTNIDTIKKHALKYKVEGKKPPK
jgi:hypothetical protein